MKQAGLTIISKSIKGFNIIGLFHKENNKNNTWNFELY